MAGPLNDADLMRAVEDAVAAEYVDSLEEVLDYQADIKGANLSGGQKQRLLISRALAGRPEILVLDDSSSPWTTRPTQPCGRQSLSTTRNPPPSWWPSGSARSRT